MINNGDRVRDKVTELEGTVIGLVKWLHGCDQAVIQPKGLHEGRPVGTVWADVNRLEVLEGEAYAATREHDAKPGGPQDIPTTPSR